MFLVINILAYTIAFFLESTMNFKLYSKEQASEQKQESMLKSMKEGFSYLKTKPVILSILWVSLWLNLFFTSVIVGTSFILVEKLKMEYSLMDFRSWCSNWYVIDVNLFCNSV